MASGRLKHTLVGAIITFVISLGTIIPAFGLFLGPLFTFGGGLLGGGVTGVLRKGGGVEGVKMGLVATFVGGTLSSVVGVVVGTLLNVILVSDSGSISGWVLIAIIGFVTGITFSVIGGLIGGGIGGALAGDAGA